MTEDVKDAVPAGRLAGRFLAALDSPRLAAGLLVAELVELTIYRLAVPALSPSGSAAPPGWHVALSYVGLFAFYFTSALALCVVASQAVKLVLPAPPTGPAAGRSPARRARAAARVAVGAAGLAFAALAAVAIAVAPGEGLSFYLEASFAVAIVLLLGSQIGRGGSLGARVGLVVLAAPLLVHFWGPLAIHLSGEEVRWSGLPDRVREVGVKLLVVAAVATPYCFSPRPFLEAAARLLPICLAGVVLAIALSIFNVSAALAFEIAHDGFGLDLGAGVPGAELALYAMAIVMVSWTIIACLTLGTPARRQIGIGLALVVVAGYGFAWPLQYLVAFAGLLLIADAAAAVADGERGASRLRFRPPPIADETWQAWLRALNGALAEHGGQAVTVRGEGEAVRSHLVATARGLPVRLTIERIDGSVSGIDVLVGREPGAAAPALTLEARRRVGADAHPPPPRTGGRGVKLVDPTLDRRFRALDAAAHAAQLFAGGEPDDAALRQRAADQLDGWLAVWPDVALRYRVHPGRGAPLDRPLPIGELSFRGADPPPPTAPAVALIDLLAELAARAGVPPATPAAADAADPEDP